ncbi:DUF305 domain-containing protein [Candidatus Saccharibacteria bacterium CG10_big_fil_rev_8_21_14_0_10_47_8]|nr:MAG: DUF305 domain-containing protein [Candidatus Saccharibacteria bacterium CG10_big_fil_rev_8_21_14_0_10_47_8]
MKKEPLLYVIIGLLAGIVLTGFFATYAVNNNQPGMMNMMGISSNRMMSGDMDRNFIEQMIPHHESAIAMAKLAQQKSAHAEVKTLADNVITSQTGEINKMKQWYKDWYGTDVPAVTTTNMWGGSMMNSQASTDSLSAATDFDKAFLSQMIDHHQMAVMMANMLDIATNRPEMKKLASDIISAQTKEINDMESWQQQWGYDSSSGNMMNTMGH